MRALLSALLVGVLAGDADAATKACGQGVPTLTPAPLTATARHARRLAGAGGAGVCRASVPSIGTATVRLEICCDAQCTAASSWAPVEGSDMSLTGGRADARQRRRQSHVPLSGQRDGVCHVFRHVRYSCAGP